MKLVLFLLVAFCVGGESCDEGFLRHVYAADGLHPLLALLLLFQQLALTGNVTA